MDLGHCYSLDLRVRVADVDAGHTDGRSPALCASEVAIKLGSGSGGSARGTGRQGEPGRGKLVPMRVLIQTVEAVPAITMPELAARRD